MCLADIFSAFNNKYITLCFILVRKICWVICRIYDDQQWIFVGGPIEYWIGIGYTTNFQIWLLGFSWLPLKKLACAPITGNPKLYQNRLHMQKPASTATIGNPVLDKNRLPVQRLACTAISGNPVLDQNRLPMQKLVRTIFNGSPMLD